MLRPDAIEFFFECGPGQSHSDEYDSGGANLSHLTVQVIGVHLNGQLILNCTDNSSRERCRLGVDSKCAVRLRTVDHDRFLTKTNTTPRVWTARTESAEFMARKVAWPPASLPELGDDGQRASQRRLRH